MDLSNVLSNQETLALKNIVSDNNGEKRYSRIWILYRMVSSKERSDDTALN